MILSKFISDDNNKLSDILSGKIWLSSPKKFNDYNDCRLDGIYSEYIHPWLRDDLIKLSEKYNYEGGHEALLPRIIYDQLKIIALNNNDPAKINFHEGLREDLIRQGAVSSIRNYFLEKSGVSCFFEGTDNELMWAHYGSGHSGVCFEFEVDDVSLSKNFNAVTYSSSPAVISLNELFFAPEFAMKRIVAAKNICWSYEKEWRIIRFEDNNYGDGYLMDIPIGMSIKRVIAGARFKNYSNINFDSFGVNLVRQKSIP